MTYDPKALSRFFDEYGEQEWDRLDATLPGRLKYSIHKHILTKHLRRDMNVLDVGCGPGRFAMDIAKAGATVTLTDISATQLELAQTRLAEADLLNHAAGFHKLDVTSLTDFADGSFDLTVCYGSVLSYVREKYSDALSELRRVTRVGGSVLVSVTSLYGPMRMIGTLDAATFVESAHDHLEWDSLLDGAEVVMTKVGSTEFHQPMALFTSSGLRGALEGAGLDVLELATSNPTIAMGSKMPNVSESSKAEVQLTQLEIALCKKPGLIDAGEHLIAVAKRV